MAISAQVSCASFPIPNVKLYAEIPFEDGSEAAFVETKTGRTGIIQTESWQEFRPYMLMIHIDDWAEIKKRILKACRGNKKLCKDKVQTIDESVRHLDAIIKKVFKP